MPRLEDYKKHTELENTMSAMDDEEFMAFATSPETEIIYKDYTEAEKTAFLARVLMLGEDSSEFRKDFVNKETNMRTDGPDEMQNVAKKEKDYDNARKFHFDIYRSILYSKDCGIIDLATSVLKHMSPAKMIEFSEKLRDTLTGHLHIPFEAEPEDKLTMQKDCEQNRFAFSNQLDDGVYSIPDPKQEEDIDDPEIPDEEEAENEAGDDLEAKGQPVKNKEPEIDEPATEDFEVTDPENPQKFKINIKVLPADSPAEDHLKNFDDPKSTKEDKRDMLFSFVSHGVGKKTVEKRIAAIRGNKVLTDLFDSYAANMNSADVLKHKDYLKDAVAGDKDAQFRLNQAVGGRIRENERKAGKTRPAGIIVGNDPFAAVDAVIRERKAQEEREKAAEEQKKAAISQQLNTGGAVGPDSKGRTWARYGDLHRIKPGERYKDEEKEIMLSKLIIAKFIQQSNGNLKDGENVIRTFNLKSARSAAETLRKNIVFRSLVKTGKVDFYMGKSDVEIVETARGLSRPFKDMTFEKRKQLIKTLSEVADHLDPSDRRTDKWKRFKAAVDALKRVKPVDNDDPERNGETELEAVMNRALEYMKGKKSLRKHADEQARFDQALDCLAELSKATPYAEMVAQATIDRVNEVRRKHDANYETIDARDFGADKAVNRGNQAPQNARNSNVSVIK